jgi:hypothetical protein
MGARKKEKYKKHRKEAKKIKRKTRWAREKHKIGLPSFQCPFIQ